MQGLFHVWFSVKHRRDALWDEVRDYVKTSIRRSALRAGVELVEIEAISDHVHILVRLHREQTLASAIHRLKGASAREILLKYPELKLDIGHQSLWQRGYGWRRIDEAELFKVRNYIRTQELRPLRHQ